MMIMKNSKFSRKAQETKEEAALYEILKLNTRNAYIIMFLACCDELHIGKKRGKRIQKKFDIWQDQIQEWIKDDVLEEKLNNYLTRLGMSVSDFDIQETINEAKKRAKYSKTEASISDQRFCQKSLTDYAGICSAKNNF